MKSALKTLARLASSRAQQIYISDATPDEYYVPEQLIEDAIHALDSGNLGTHLSAQALSKALKSFRIPEGVSNRELVEVYEPWCRVRVASRNLLEDFKFDLEEWEESEL